MKCIFFTVNVPFGTGEEFLLPELLALKQLGLKMVICPRKAASTVAHQEAESLVSDALSMPLMSLRILKLFVSYTIKHPWQVVELYKQVACSAASVRIGLKNIAVFPKAVAIAVHLRSANIDHAHACWASTPATMAYIFSKINRVPLSLTLHRHDIYQNNLLRLKLCSAVFARCISQRGKKDVLQSVGRDLEYKIKVIHMGVRVNGTTRSNLIRYRPAGRAVHFIVPAALLPVKGHHYLIDACKILVNTSTTDFICTFYGNGRLKRQLTSRIVEQQLTHNVIIHNAIPHQQLLNLYAEQKVDCVILPSIVTKDGEFEGIPVSLLEAMAYGIPVISTSTGSIPELLDDECGRIVKEKDPAALAHAMLNTMHDLEERRDDPQKRMKKIKGDFNIVHTSQHLFHLLKTCQ